MLIDSLLATAKRMIAEGQATHMMVYELGDEMDRCHVVGKISEFKGA
jgi:hypothetical protein